MSKKVSAGWEDRDLFVANAFFLWERRERILSDPRMAMCKPRIFNNLAYLGHIPSTLGGYLTWWRDFDRARRTGRRGRPALIFLIAGSPLSGMNHCSEVYENGKTRVIKVAPFKPYWSSFAAAQKPFLGAVSPTLTLAEVIAILKEESLEQ